MINIGKLLFGTKTDFKQLLADGALVVDVRTPDEFRAGNVRGSLNIPLDSIPAKLNEIKAKKRKIIAVCLSGGRSAAAADMLRRAGIEAFNGGGWAAFEKAVK